MGLFDKSKRCEYCGSSKNYELAQSLVTFATTDMLDRIILKCYRCGKFLCYSCSDKDSTGLLSCPGCGGRVAQPKS